MLQARLLPLGHLGKSAQRGFAVVDFGQRLIVPLHGDQSGAGAVALFYQYFYKLRLIQIGKDPHVLPLLDMDAGYGNESGIAAQYGLFQNNSLLRFFIFHGENSCSFYIYFTTPPVCLQWRRKKIPPIFQDGKKCSTEAGKP